MTEHHNATISTLPSSILHNGNDVRRQYTRAAAKQVVQTISRKMGAWKKKAAHAAPDLQHGLQGEH